MYRLISVLPFCNSHKAHFSSFYDVLNSIEMDKLYKNIKTKIYKTTFQLKVLMNQGKISADQCF